jgi:hypothetical protein
VFRRPSFPILAAVLYFALSEPSAAIAKGKPELALQYDFLSGEGPQISDGSGRKHVGNLQDGEIVYGRNKYAVKLHGNGMILMAELPKTLNPASRALTVGAFCQPLRPDGVVVAMGDKTNGFSLYLKGGVPQFAVRSNGALSKVVAREPVVINQWVHLAGAIDPRGKLLLLVNGWPAASEQGKLIAGSPTEAFSVGADPGSPVGDYTAPHHWDGLIQDVRLYWDILERTDRDQWQDWADLPGCGCKK